MTKFTKQGQTAKNVNQLVEIEFEKVKHLFHSIHRNRYLLYLKWLVQDYLNKYPISNQVAHVEKAFHTQLNNGVKLKGKLDRVDIREQSLKVIDYKTGGTLPDISPYVDENDHGTKYWQQGMVYTKLMMDNFPGYAEYEFEFHYPEQKKVVIPFSFTEDSNFESWLSKIWGRIHEMKFQVHCVNPACLFCNNTINQ
jgi:hypothetical protein